MDRRMWVGALTALLLPLPALAKPVASRQTSITNLGVKAIFDKESGKPTVYGIPVPFTFQKTDAGKMLEIVADSPNPVKIELWTGTIPAGATTWEKKHKFLGGSGELNRFPSFKWMIEPGTYTALILATVPPGEKPEPFLVSYGKEVREATAEDKAQWDKAVNDYTLGKIQALQAKRAPAPAFTAFTTERATITLAKLRKKVVLLYFWSTQDANASQNLSFIDSLATQHKAEGLEVIGISLDQDQQAFENIMQNGAPSWPQVFDPGTGNEALAAKYNVTGWSGTFLIDGTGRIIARDQYGNALARLIVNSLYENQEYLAALAAQTEKSTDKPAATTTGG